MTTYTARLPADFVGGQAFSKRVVWQELISYNSNKGVIPPIPVKKAIDQQGINLFDREFFSPKLPLTFNGVTYPDMASLQSSWPAGANYKSFYDAGPAYIDSLMVELVSKQILRELTAEERARATFSPIGFVDQSELKDGTKLRMTYHWLRNSQCKKLPVDLAHVGENGAALSALDEVYLLDLRSYYWP